MSLRIEIPHAGRDPRGLTPAEFEEHRHAHEVNHCLAAGFDWTKDHCEALVSHKWGEQRGRAERIWRDVRSAWAAQKDAVRAALPTNGRVIASAHVDITVSAHENEGSFQPELL